MPSNSVKSTTLYRAVGGAEFADIMSIGAFRAEAISYSEGKFCAETAGRAAEWGDYSMVRTSELWARHSRRLLPIPSCEGNDWSA